jgi:hypothetical protein
MMTALRPWPPAIPAKAVLQPDYVLFNHTVAGREEPPWRNRNPGCRMLDKPPDMAYCAMQQ